MKCPGCGHENRHQAKFCEECGLSFRHSCSSCGAELRPKAKFCDECGKPAHAPPEAVAERDPRAYTPKHLAEKILTSRSALEGERKQVTVLFADVQGSVALSESVDPETLHRIMDRFFAILADGVHRFEGTVNQYTGDGIMALFGAPIAHEDHAGRACYAALHLRDELRRYADELRLNQGLNFSVRMGLNSGEVVVGKIGDDLRMDYTAQGHTVGLAARVEQIAESGRVYLTQHTASLVEGFFQLRDLGPLAVKGVQDPLRVYELQGVGKLRTRLDVSQARGFSKFVGRGNETAALEAALERAIQGNGQVIGVVGEAGVGKSRLCYEFVQGCRARGLTVTEAHGVAHGKTIPFLGVLEYLRNYFGTTEQDTEQSAREKIAGKVVLLDPELSDALPLLFDFLGVPDPERPVQRMDPEARQRQLFAAMKRITHAQGRREPTLAVMEDLQWIDAGSEAFLENFVEALAGTRHLLVVNFRPEYHAGWMQRSYYQQMPLLPLGSEAITELLRDLLGTAPSLAGLADRIRDRTGGNPFFIEEVVRSLIEAGSLEGSSGAYRLVKPVDEVAIPARVQSVLAARIDRLGESEKQVFQTASVIGRTFSEPILKAVAELPETDLAASLSSLQRAEFIYEEALYPEAVYAFKHALTQEVAYHSQLTEQRARVHAAVARTIAELYPDKLDEQAALIAHHWEEAGEALEAARWHCRAAEWAGTSHLAEALGHWRKVRELLERVPESAETMALGVAACTQMLNVGWRLGAPEEEVASMFIEGKALAERSGDLRLLARLVLTYAVVRGSAGEVEEYLNHAEEAARVADQTDDAGLKAGCRDGRMVADWWAGHLREALMLAEENLAQTSEDPRLGADIFGFGLHVNTLILRGLIVSATGRHEEAEADLDRALGLARQHGDAENLCWAHAVYVPLARNAGHIEAALGHARHAVEIAEKIGSPFSRVTAYEQLGEAHILSDEWSQAAAALEEALHIARETRSNLVSEPFILASLAEAQLGVGDKSRARQTADEAVAVARRRGTRYFECLAHLARARVLLHTEGAAASADIQDALKQAQTLVEETGGRSREPFIHEERANLARLTRDDATRGRELRKAHRLFTEMGATGHAERLAKELGL
jgi:class 3 adenylate cyclase/tetratricopeptide (TPR) repeat protein